MKDNNLNANILLKCLKSNDPLLICDVLKTSNQTLVDVTQSLADKKVKISYHQKEFESKIVRYVLSNDSIYTLVMGNPNTVLKANLDIFSLYAISRMQLEAFAMIYYLFFDKISIEDKDFRYDLYKLNGLCRQSHFEALDQKNKHKKNKLIIELNELKTKLRNNSFFLKLPIKMQNKYLDCKFYENPKLIKTEDILKLTGLKESRIFDLWKIYSNHIHSEHIGDRQFNAWIKNQHQLNESICLLLNVQLIVSSKLTWYVCETFEEGKKSLKDLPSKNQFYYESIIGHLENN